MVTNRQIGKTEFATQQIADEESAVSKPAKDRSAAKRDAAKSNDERQTAAYDAAYQAVYRIIGADSKTPEYDHCMAAYDAAKAQLTQDQVERNRKLVAELAITALYDAARDWNAKRPHLPR